MEAIEMDITRRALNLMGLTRLKDHDEFRRKLMEQHVRSAVGSTAILSWCLFEEKQRFDAFSARFLLAPTLTAFFVCMTVLPLLLMLRFLLPPTLTAISVCMTVLPLLPMALQLQEPLPPPRRRRILWKKMNKQIGSGSFGKVYLGFDRETNQYCAIKEVNVDHLMKQLGQLKREIDLLRQLSCHQNIVKYYGSSLTDNVLSIYMEYVPNGSIHMLLKKSGTLEESKIRKYTAQILAGLDYMHRMNVVHRDIKGANILVGCNDEIKLADFGLAKLISPVAEIHSACRGTFYWMAPEVILSVQSGKGYDVRADIWSLGCTIIEMATGNHPWHEHCMSGQQCIEQVAVMYMTAFTDCTPEIPERLSDEGKDFLRLCFQREPTSRPTAAELMDHPFIKNRPRRASPAWEPIPSASGDRDYSQLTRRRVG